MSNKPKKSWLRLIKRRTIIVLFILSLTLTSVSSLLAQSRRSQQFPNLTPSREVKRGAKYGAIAFIALAVIYALARLASTSERRLAHSQARPHDAQLTFDPLTQPAPIFPDEAKQREQEEDEEERDSSTANDCSSPLADFIPGRFKEKAELSTLCDNATYVRFRADDVELRLLKSELSRDLAAKGHFIKAGKKLATLKHENLFQVTAVEYETWPFWQVKLLEGKTLEEGKPTENGYSCCQVLEMAKPLFGLLDYLRGEKQKLGLFSQSTILVSEDGKPIVAHMDPYFAANEKESDEADEATEDEELKKAQRADLLSLAHMLEILTEEHGRPPQFDELLQSLRENGGNLELSLAELSTKVEEMMAEFPCKEGWNCAAGKNTEGVQSSHNTEGVQSSHNTEGVSSAEDGKTEDDGKEEAKKEEANN